MYIFIYVYIYIYVYVYMHTYMHTHILLKKAGVFFQQKLHVLWLNIHAHKAYI